MSLPDICPWTDNPICPTCNVRVCQIKKMNGKVYFRNRCSECIKSPKINRNRAIRKTVNYKLQKMNPCVICGFIPTIPGQMDWDHIDGNRFNNSLENKQLMCSNCHRAKTYNSGEYVNGRYKYIEVNVVK